MKTLIQILSQTWLILSLVFTVLIFNQIYKDLSFKRTKLLATKNYIEAYKNKANRIPSIVQFKRGYFQCNDVEYFPKNLRSGEYSFKIWRGEWYETYNSSTNTFSPEHSTNYFILLGVLILTIGILPQSFLWVKKKRKNE